MSEDLIHKGNIGKGNIGKGTDKSSIGRIM